MSDYQAKTDRIQELANAPEALGAHISNHVDGITQHLPNISQSIGNAISTNVGFLNSKIAKPVQQFPLSAKWEPSEAHKQKFEKYYSAVDDPTSVLKLIKSGDLTSEAMESLKVCHPELLQHMQQQLVKQADPESAKNLPYHVKQSISMFLGAPLDESLYQPVLAANQAAFANPAQSNADKKMAAGKSTQSGLEKLGFAKRAETELTPEETSGKE
jgi:hypothetical protein